MVHLGCLRAFGEWIVKQRAEGAGGGWDGVLARFKNWTKVQLASRLPWWSVIYHCAFKPNVSKFWRLLMFFHQSKFDVS